MEVQIFFISFLISILTGEGIGAALAGTAGFFAGAAIGQTLIPIPFVGALIGGILGESALKAVYKGIQSLLGIKPKKEEEVEVDQGEFVDPDNTISSENLINQTTSGGGFSLTDGFIGAAHTFINTSSSFGTGTSTFSIDISIKP